MIAAPLDVDGGQIEPEWETCKRKCKFEHDISVQTVFKER